MLYYIIFFNIICYIIFIFLFFYFFYFFKIFKYFVFDIFFFIQIFFHKFANFIAFIYLPFIMQFLVRPHAKLYFEFTPKFIFYNNFYLLDEELIHELILSQQNSVQAIAYAEKVSGAEYDADLRSRLDKEFEHIKKNLDQYSLAWLFFTDAEDPDIPFFNFINYGEVIQKKEADWKKFEKTSEKDKFIISKEDDIIFWKRNREGKHNYNIYIFFRELKKYRIFLYEFSNRYKFKFYGLTDIDNLVNRKFISSNLNMPDYATHIDMFSEFAYDDYTVANSLDELFGFIIQFILFSIITWYACYLLFVLVGFEYITVYYLFLIILFFFIF